MNVKIEGVTNGPVVNESLETSIEGVFACGNVLHVHDLVDNVTREANDAGYNAGKYALSNNLIKHQSVNITTCENISYSVPTKILLDNENVVITPHNAFNSIEAVNRIINTTIENIKNNI